MTFSLAARCARTGALGVAVTSSSPAVASRCAHVRAGTGAAATQNVTDPSLGPAMLDELDAGADAGDALEAVRGRAANIEHRQLAVVDAAGGTAAYSGTHTLGVHGSRVGPDCVVTGNLLAGAEVLDAALAAFGDDQDAPLEARLLAGLAAGVGAGGESGPLHSAGLLVSGAVRWPVTDLRVDWSDEPVAGLQYLWELWEPQKDDYLLRALDPTRAPGYGVPGDTR